MPLLFSTLRCVSLSPRLALSAMVLLPFSVTTQTLHSSWSAASYLLLALLTLPVLLARAQGRQQADRQLEDLSVRLAERERIARELHDTWSQSLIGLTIGLQTLVGQMPPGDPQRRFLESQLDLADQLFTEGRERILALREAPYPAASTSGLPGTLAALGRRLAAEQGTHFAVEHHGHARPLKGPVQDEVLCIAKEAMLNAFRHASANHVTLRLHYAPFGFRVEIADDGIGIPSHTLSTGRPGHWGLIGMRERAHTVSARLSIRSSAGKGTCITVGLAAWSAYGSR